jgi:hypothetical protein
LLHAHAVSLAGRWREGRLDLTSIDDLYRSVNGNYRAVA